LQYKVNVPFCIEFLFSGNSFNMEEYICKKERNPVIRRHGTFVMFIFSACLLFQIMAEEKLPLYEGSLRFHIRAASDTVLEQELKITARDAALKMIRKTADRANSARELETALKKQEAEIREGVRACLSSAGHERNVKVYFVEERFPIRRYGAIIFPAGRYHALRIDIGGGRGHNWWCALYPELCYNEKEFVLSEKGRKYGK